MIRLKRLICIVLLLVLLAAPVAIAADAAADDAPETEDTTIDTENLEAMLAAARTGEDGTAAEAAWNRQIEAEDLDATATEFFESEYTGYRIAVEIADYIVALGITELNGETLQFQIVASSLNLREGPEREYERIGSFAHGTIVTSLGRNADGWLNVTDGELAGWASVLHMAPFDGTPAPVWEEPVTRNTSGGGGGGSTGGSGGGNPTAAPPTGHTQDDLWWLALTIQIEAGSNWLCDDHQRMVAEVVVNRVAHPSFPPTTIHGIIHQSGQYPWAARGVRIPISDRAFANAQWVLDGGRVATAPIVFQSQGRQGTVYRSFRCDILNTTTFFGFIG